jgi:hypothetical protein
MIITPTNRDVINGRGQGKQRIPGNVKFRELVAANKVSKLDWICMHFMSDVRSYLIFCRSFMPGALMDLRLKYQRWADMSM